MVADTAMEMVDQTTIIRLLGTDVERQAMFAAYAREKLAEADRINQAATGRLLPHTTTVDGVAGRAEDQVNPNNGGEIVYRFVGAITDILTWIEEQLVSHSPVGENHDPHPGQYQHAHQLFADGVLIPFGTEPPLAAQYVFINPLPYAGRIERGESAQDPHGVYEGIAALASQRFAGAASIVFEYRVPDGSKYQSPAIVVTPGS